MNKKNVLITGVSTGIGYGAADELLSRGHTVFGTVRKKSDAQKLQAKHGDLFTTIVMDVTDQDAIDAAVTEIGRLVKDDGLQCLINNSGIAIGGPLQHQSMDDIEKQFDVNVFGLLRVTKAFLPLLGASKNSSFKPGRIINISSVGGKVSAPFVGAYSGTKHAVEGLSASLRRELLLFGVEVIIVGPGAVQTPIWNKGINMDPYGETDYARSLKRFAKGAKRGAEKGLTIEFLGKKIAGIVESKNPKLRYAFVPQKMSNWTIPKLIPDRWLDKIIKKQLFK